MEPGRADLATLIEDGVDGLGGSAVDGERREGNVPGQG